MRVVRAAYVIASQTTMVIIEYDLYICMSV